MRNRSPTLLSQGRRKIVEQTKTMETISGVRRCVFFLLLLLVVAAAGTKQHAIWADQFLVDSRDILRGRRSEQEGSSCSFKRLAEHSGIPFYRRQ